MDIAVALLGSRDLARRLSQRCGVVVEPTTVEDHLEIAARLDGDVELAMGLSTVPWPSHPELHAEASATLDAYTGVVSWHALPSLHTSLAQAVEPAVKAGAHVLVTAPDPGPQTDPGDLLFLREVAEAVDARVGFSSRSIAWRGGTRSPTSVEALTSLVEAHGKRDVVECPVAPGTGPDPQLTVIADRLGARVGCADLGTGTLVDLLSEVVDTVAGHGLGTPPAATNEW